MNKMRILHLVHQYPPDFTGGTELYTQMLAATQAQNGHHVAVFCPSPNSDSSEALVVGMEQGIQVYRLPLGPRSRTQVFRDTFRQQELQAGLALVLERENPDLIHIQHLMGMPMGLAGQIVKAGVPYVVTLHDYWYVCANAQLFTNTDQIVCSGPDRLAVNCGHCALARAGKEGSKWLAPGIAPLMLYRNQRLHKVLEKAATVVAPTDFVRQTYNDLEIGNENMVVIRHGIEPPLKAAGSKQEKRSLIEGDPRLHIGYIGSIASQKGVHVLIEAANKLPAEQVQLTIYGDLLAYPTYVARLNEAIQRPNIRLAGPLTRDGLWPALADLDLVVLPTLWYETSSLVLDEAFAAGVPVVASNIGVLADKVQDGGNGRLFSPGDANALAKALNEILADPGLLDRWQNGIPSVRTIADHVREIEELYQLTLDTV